MTTIQFDKKLKCGNVFVAVRVLDVQNETKIGNVYLPDTYASNGRLAHCKVEDVGSGAKEKLGIEVGDYVMIDRLATFAWTAPVAALKYDSVICKTDEGKTDFFPLKDMLFVEPDKKDSMTEVGGLLVANYDKRLNLGTVTKTNFEKTDEYPFEAGDKVMLVKGGDLLDTGDVKIHIFKKDMIVCTVEDN